MRVLFAALNWGMGHASRSVPLIRAFQEAGVEVILASDGVAAELWRAEFPDLEVRELPGYKVTYPSRNIYLNVLRSGLRILLAMRRERRWLHRELRRQPVDAVISDNRYGIRHPGVPSVLITHQLHFAGPWRWANRIGEFFVRRLIRRYQEVWVPDWSGENSLSGGMARWSYTRPPLYYVGPLSRFPIQDRTNVTPTHDIIAILSGPEPQRTYFEQAIREQLVRLPGRHILVRGVRDTAPADWPSGDLEIYDILPADDLQALVADSKLQVSRTGYSTIMDLVYSGVPALLIPTPGQIEQEYLLEYLEGMGPWAFQHQSALDIPSAWDQLERLQAIPSQRPTGRESRAIIAEFIQRIQG